MGILFSCTRPHKTRAAPPSKPSPLTQSRKTESVQMKEPCHGASTHPTHPNGNKKALLIGIRYEKGRCRGFSSMDLGNAPHNETQMWRDMLQKYCEYPEDQIVCMQDISKNQGTDRWPDKENILQQLQELVHGVKPGDRRFLFIAAHGSQHENTTGTELDGKDEMMYTLEGNGQACKTIKDNDLRHILVDKFPADANLTIVLELCHSGTLIDLPFRLSGNENGPFTIVPAKKKPANLAGNILCLSACDDGQNAPEYRQKSSQDQQGILTTVIHHNLGRQSKIRVTDLYSGLLKACELPGSSHHAAGQTSGADDAQTPVVTLGRELSGIEIQNLVFRP